ncbi:glycoside hydrolase family 6 protein [Streptomyces sp. NPDC048696]|uniref:glycoside hydrolase family 6 protein n=1 Tax=Streptomyces sp. NPDC048696 TaxID=3365585 RepID=UPI003722D2BF
MSRHIPRQRGLLAAALLALAVACSGCSSGSADPGPAPATPAAQGRSGDGAEPAPEGPFWVDPDSSAARQIKIWEAQGRTADAEALRRIADRPTALWAAWDDPRPGIRAAVAGAAKDRRTVLLVAYNIPHRDCGGLSAGGAADVAAYRTWYGMFGEAIGDAKAIVVLEPDAVAHMVDGCTTREHWDERYQLLNEAVDHFKKLPHTKVYLDAGNPAWIPDPNKLVEPLTRAGVARADGFALNVSNFQTDDAVRAYGTKVSQGLGGKHFVVDTSRNGAGPLLDDREQAWCNPPGRALGTPPTASTGFPLVDAYLWIKRPGDSDGTCRGGPAAGAWWPEYALGLARRAKA